MPYTVAFSFDKFVENISLDGDQREIATARKDRIVSLLKKDFEILDAFPSGSIPRFTAVKGYADLDVVVVLHYGKHIKDRLPSAVLKSVRESLAKYRTGVRRNGQAVTLSYETWPNVDIVPVARITNDDKTVDYYDVPDMNTESWLKSRPRKHSSALDERAKICGDEFKKLIRMIKWWNKQHSDYLQSFHIEVIALEALTSEIRDFPWAVYQYFDKASALIKKSLWYELGYADDYLDSESRDEAASRLETAREKARDAWYLTYNGRNEDKEAIAVWRQIFRDEFPAYG